ncbi:MAG: hypothetical protein RLZZ321_389 [Bacteroidota bacterium]|jgi:hypothetical protein
MQKKRALYLVGLIGLALAAWFIFKKQELANQVDSIEKTKLSAPTKGQEISTDFNINTFKSKKEPLLLKQLRLCDSTLQWSEDENRPSCTPNFFRVFPLKKGLDLSQGCMVLMKAGVNHFPVRRFVIYEREGTQLVQANGFIGYPIELRPNANGYDDIVIRFFERYQGEKYFYNCLFTWKQHRYQYVCCEQINDADIKPEKQKEVSAEIWKILYEKQLAF